MSNPNYPAFDDKARKQLATGLLLIRIGIAVVFFMWTIDKFINPAHTAAVFAKFYMVPGLSATLAYAIGVVQMLIIIAFLVGYLRTWSYGLILILHAVSTVTSWSAYIDPWTYPHLLFFAAIPMLSACLALWTLRRFDAYTVDACWAPSSPHSEATTAEAGLSNS